MAWTLGAVRIYTQEFSQAGRQVIARLQPLSGTTVKQIFGYESDIYRVVAKIVGDTNKATLDGYKEDGSTHELIGPEGSIGSFYVSSVSFKRDSTYYQTLDTTQDCTTPVYTVEIEIM